MGKIIKILMMVTVLAAASALKTDAKSIIPFNILEKMANSPKTPLDSAAVAAAHTDEKVIVGKDTVSIILPQKNYGRYDRGLLNYLYIPKGQWSFGMTASYGEFNTDDVQMLSVLNNLDLKIKAYSLRPYVSYFFKNNQSIGINFNYTRMVCDLGAMTLDISDDMNFSLANVSYYSKNYSTAIAYRNYVGLGRDRRFGVFNEVALAFGAGSSRFRRTYDGVLYDTRTSSMSAALNFSPGVCVFIMDYVAFNVSFGVFGVNFHHERQSTNGVDEGRRFSSGANFRFNLFNINFGLAVFI